MCTLYLLFHSIQNFAKVVDEAIMTDWKTNHMTFSINEVYNQTSISSKPHCPLATFNSFSSYTVVSWTGGKVNAKLFLSLSFKKIFLTIYLYLREREREREQGKGKKRGRHRIRNRLLAFELLAQSPMQGLNSQTVRSWPKPKSNA